MELTLDSNNLLQSDLEHLWHPCSQMKDYEAFAPLLITDAKGSYLELNNGQQIIDAVSSWWCKSLGHGHPKLRDALIQQAGKFEHVMLANVTHQPVIELSSALANLTNTLNKVMYASDGSCAVEIAMKMSLHARQILGQSKKNYFMALSNSYHGETCGALAASDLKQFCEPYRPILPDVGFIKNIPYVTGKNDPLWNDCSAKWPAIEAQLNLNADRLTAILVEPIVQGAGGMLIHSQDFLRHLRVWTKANDVHLIADEIVTGFGRTGKMLACQHANIEPDFLCLGKGLTAGWLPMSATLTTDDIYNLFYDEYEKGKTFSHSHTFTGNPLAAAVALASLKIIEEEKIIERSNQLEIKMLQLMQKIANESGKLYNIRAIGGVVAADLIVENNQQRIGYEIFQKAVKLGALLRPLGNTIYWLPPLNLSDETLQELAIITLQAIL